MPDRIIRDELLESERWLDLPSAECRLAFTVLLLYADPMGNLEGHLLRLARIWTGTVWSVIDGGCSPDCSQLTRDELVKADLIRCYQVDGKDYVHIPRYRQRLRYLSNIKPLSPWTTDQQIEALKKDSPDLHPVLTSQKPVTVGSAPPKRSEVKRDINPKVLPNTARGAPISTEAKVKTNWDKSPPNNKDKPTAFDRAATSIAATAKTNGHAKASAEPPTGWHTTEQGIEACGRLLGEPARSGESWQQWKSRLFEKLSRS